MSSRRFIDLQQASGCKEAGVEGEEEEEREAEGKGGR